MRKIFLSLASFGIISISFNLSLHGQTFRTYDGSLNNPNGWGQSGSPFIRLSFPAYEDGIREPSGADRPNPRDISNAIGDQSTSLPSSFGFSDYIWQWGQFIDHDFTLTRFQDPMEPFFIPVTSLDDILYNPTHPFITLVRSEYIEPENNSGPRQQINSNTHLIDASMIYGSDTQRALTLRSMTGGRLKTADLNLLPFNTFGLPNENEHRLPPEILRIAGDVRANEQPGLTAMHTVWMREHNRQADLLAQEHPEWSDELLYQHARKRVSALVQIVTYQEWLPALMGPYAPSLENRRYNPTVNPTLANEFAGACFRLGHTFINSVLQRVQADGSPAPGGGYRLRDVFFSPDAVNDPNEINYLLKGLASQRAQTLDAHIVSELRSFLFPLSPNGTFDLLSLNIQRGRDHGFPGYNAIRQAVGLSPKSSFAEITSDPDLQTALASVYSSPDQIDLWIGAMSEDHLPEASIGELLARVLSIQFTNLMEGDRYFFLWDPNLTDEERETLRATRLSMIIARNSEIGFIQENAFFVPEMGPDQDLDGMPDGWERFYSLNPLSDSDGSLDMDQDGMDNLTEFRTGTNPRDADSFMGITIGHLDTQTINVILYAEANKTYQVLATSDLSSGEWEIIAEIQAQTEGRLVTVTDVVPFGVNRFYRLMMP